MSAIENLYRSNGFRQVKVTSNVEDDYAGRKDELAVSIHVEEGAQTRISSLQILGNTAISDRHTHCPPQFHPRPALF